MSTHQQLICCLAMMFFLSGATALAADEANHIQIYDKNPRYWQYMGQPVLLLGGSKTDHIFLAEGLKELLAACRKSNR